MTISRALHKWHESLIKSYEINMNKLTLTGEQTELISIMPMKQYEIHNIKHVRVKVYTIGDSCLACEVKVPVLTIYTVLYE